MHFSPRAFDYKDIKMFAKARNDKDLQYVYHLKDF